MDAFLAACLSMDVSGGATPIPGRASAARTTRGRDVVQVSATPAALHVQCGWGGGGGLYLVNIIAGLSFWQLCISVRWQKKGRGDVHSKGRGRWCVSVRYWWPVSSVKSPGCTRSSCRNIHPHYLQHTSGQPTSAAVCFTTGTDSSWIGSNVHHGLMSLSYQIPKFARVFLVSVYGGRRRSGHP